jgi:hypothetical protein
MNKTELDRIVEACNPSDGMDTSLKLHTTMSYIADEGTMKFYRILSESIYTLATQLAAVQAERDRLRQSLEKIGRIAEGSINEWRMLLIHRTLLPSETCLRAAIGIVRDECTKAISPAQSNVSEGQGRKETKKEDA